jgi:hypothetical protein
MSTRNLTMVVDREKASHNDLGFACDPDMVSDNSYVNMYLHHDGYPEWQGVQLANWVLANRRQDGSAMAAKLVHDHYYDSCYLYPDVSNIDHQYTYIIWTGKRDDIWISCYDQYSSENIFVLPPEKIIEKYSHKRFKDGYTNYTNWADGETKLDKHSGKTYKHTN